MKKTLLKIGIFGPLFVLLAASIVFQKTLTPPIKINEVSFQNNDGNDWIELYNPSLNTRNLKGLYLTDDKSEKTKFQIENDIAITPKGFIVIGGKNATKDEGVFRTNFGLKNGETLYLVAENGISIVDSFLLIAEDENSTKTVGRFPDGVKETFTFSTATRGQNNYKDKP